MAGEVVEFTCVDCGGHVKRDPNAFDVDNLTPGRCVQCTLSRMREVEQ